jgi:hypothetical protein
MKEELMDGFDVERDDARKRKAEQPGREPRAEQPGRLGWASALGNAAVQRLFRSVGIQRAGDGAVVEDSVGRAIHSKRGTGQSLDSTTQRDMEQTFGHDFSDVRVHTDTEAQSLNRALRAEAFTTGKDIFFNSGRYNPGSADGRKLLSHELTHVVQQRSAPAAQDLTVSDPSDAAERQASNVAEHLGSAAPAPSLGRKEDDQLPGGLAGLGLQAEEEEEEVQMSSAVERQEVPEEEEEAPA